MTNRDAKTWRDHFTSGDLVGVAGGVTEDFFLVGDESGGHLNYFYTDYTRYYTFVYSVPTF